MVVFRPVCKLVKLFCKQRGIYGANLCYLNGMSIQIITMRVMEILYSKDHLRADFMLPDVDRLLANPLEVQVEFVFEHWFLVFGYLLMLQELRGKVEPIKLAHRQKWNKEMVIYDEFMGACHPFVMDSDLSVMTPVLCSRNASASVMGSSFHAIFKTIQEAKTLVRLKQQRVLHELPEIKVSGQPLSL